MVAVFRSLHLKKVPDPFFVHMADKPFDRLTALSKVEGLTALSEVEGRPCHPARTGPPR
jgi:hypothetical protein